MAFDCGLSWLRWLCVLVRLRHNFRLGEAGRLDYIREHRLVDLPRNGGLKIGRTDEFVISQLLPPMHGRAKGCTRK